MKFATCLGLALAMTPLASAQQFQTPTLPGELQARLQHAEALKAQMLRAQQEQGAPSEFARKAYEAQRAYQAERAFDEYNAYLEKQKQLAQFQTDQLRASQGPTNSKVSNPPAAYQPPLMRLPKPVQPTDAFTSVPAQAPSQPRTFSPPVHVVPTSGRSFSNFGDEPKTPDEVDQTGSRHHQQVAYQETPPAQRPAPAQALYEYQPPRQSDYQPTQTYTPSRRSLASPQRMISNPNPVSKQRVADQVSVSSQQPPRLNRQREYILQENGYEGLQDKISSLLAKPRYRVTRTGQPQLAQSAMTSPLVESSKSIQRRVPPRQLNSPPRRARQQQPAPLARSQPTIRQITGQANQQPQSNGTHPLRQPTDAVDARRNAEVQYAFETQRRAERAVQKLRTIQQVAMLTPSQDPFNDQSVELPPGSDLPALKALQDFRPSAPRPDRQAMASPPQDDQVPMRQISVLSNRTQDSAEAPENQFGQPLRSQESQQPDQSFQPPANANASQMQEPFGTPSAEDQKRIDDEMNRRLRQIEDRPADENSRVDEMVQELENELEQSRNQQRDSILDDALENQLEQMTENNSQRIVSNLKTCDEIRGELLKGSIRDIALDMSPLASRNRSQNTSISRSWMDQAGNIVATGKMVDLRRSYVIIDGVNGRVKLPVAKLSDADWAAISEYWRIPELCSVGTEGIASRNWIPQTYTWNASSLCHKPLFFENIQLERYGHTHGPLMQPIRSVAHFFVSYVTVPYQSGIHPANECQYALGFYRPGDCAPWLKNPVPLSLSGAARQAFVTTGVAVIP